MLKHRHEILSGVTSSISYRYILHENALLRAIDTPGSEKYRKTLFKSLTTHNIDVMVVALEAADKEMAESFSFFATISKAIQVPFVVVVCKTDAVSAKEIASNLHSLLAVHSEEAFEIVQNESNFSQEQERIPILLTSCKTGEGIRQLEHLLTRKKHSLRGTMKNCKFQVQKILKATSESCILYGQTTSGELSTATSNLLLGPVGTSNASFVPIQPVSVMIDGKTVECIPTSFSGSILIQQPFEFALHAGISIVQVDSRVRCGVLKMFCKFLVQVLHNVECTSVTAVMLRGQLIECNAKQPQQNVEKSHNEIEPNNQRLSPKIHLIQVEFTKKEDAFLVRPGDVVVLFGSSISFGQVVKLLFR
jgi:GTPase